jgi:hypothetical protein
MMMFCSGRMKRSAAQNIDGSKIAHRRKMKKIRARESGIKKDVRNYQNEVALLNEYSLRHKVR